VQSASAQRIDGQWIINFDLNRRGSREWDMLTRARFHAQIAVVLNGRVISAPIVQPLQSSWTSFHGQVQVSAGFTQQQANTIASEF
jgi:preprotein translocase subunit SecD